MPDTPAPDSPAKVYPRALAGAYARATLWFLGLVALLWMFGFEAIHGHPTPFYALIAPVYEEPVDLPWALAGALGAALLIATLARGFVPRDDGLGDRPGPESPPLTRRQLAMLVAFAAVFPAVTAMMRGGPEGISQAYARQSYEYISDIGSGGSIRGLFHDYEKIHPYLSMHAKVHPPGPIAILWTFSFVAGRTPMGLSIATILFGALSVLPMYWLARDMLGERRGQIAVLIYSLMPTIVLFTATSADITFMPFTLMTLCFFWRSVHGEPRDQTPASASSRLVRTLAVPVAAGVLYGVLGLISFSLLSLGAFFAFIGLWRLFDARYRRAVVRTAVVMVIATVTLHLLVYLWSGYNSIAIFELCRQQFETDQANLDQMDPRWPAWAFRFVNPMSWFFFAGIPASALALRRMQSSFTKNGSVFLIIGLTLLAFDILYLARGEGERSAMYVMPFIALPAAHMLDEICAAARSWRPLTVTLVFLGVQCIATEAILYTYW